MLQRSLIQCGCNQRMKHVIERARSGEDITIAFLGGSVTEKYKVRKEESYAMLSYQYFAENYGNQDNVTYVNAGMAGTSSLSGLIRSNRDVLCYRPDVIFLEYAVNDFKDSIHKEAFESLILRLMHLENKPAVVLLFLLSESRYTCQGHMQVIGEYYQLPMISISDALLPELEGNHIEWLDYYADYIHPNKLGHEFIKDCIAYYFDTVDNQEISEKEAIQQNPVYGNQFITMKLIDSKNANVVSFGDFQATNTIAQFPNGWVHKPGDSNESLRFKITCKSLFVIYKESNNTAEGKAELYVDGMKRITMQGYNSTGWDNPATLIVFQDNKVKEHFIEVKMNYGEQQKEFTLLGFGYCD